MRSPLIGSAGVPRYRRVAEMPPQPSGRDWQAVEVQGLLEQSRRHQPFAIRGLVNDAVRDSCEQSRRRTVSSS
jgi:hypothetical protein